MLSKLARFFELEARGTTVAREAGGAVATFLTMAYILFANPGILAAAGVLSRALPPRRRRRPRSARSSWV